MADTPKIQDIQALRGVAITLVLMEHLSIGRAVFEFFFPGYKMPFHVGVELFFIISGYVVTLTVLRRRNFNPLDFLWRRAVRLYPAMLAFIAFSAIVMALAALMPPSDWRDTRLVDVSRFLADAAYMLTGTLVYKHSLYYSGAMWSLSVEFQFYLAFALVIAVAGLLRSPARILFFLSVGTIAICMTYRFLPDNLKTVSLLNHMIHYRFDYFPAGVAIATGSNRIGRYFPSYTATAAIILGLVAGAVYPDTPLGNVLLMNLFVIAALAAETGRAFICHGYLYRALLWLGNRSYSIYMLQFSVMALVWIVMVAFIPPFIFVGYYNLIQFALVVPVLLLLSDLSYRLVEVPVNRLAHSKRVANDPASARA